MQDKNQLLISALCVLCICGTPVTVQASDAPGVVLQEQERREAEPQDNWEDKINQKIDPYFTDEAFAAFCEPLKEQIQNGSTDAALKLYAFLASKGASEKQTEQILNEGYLTDCVEDLKTAGILPETYELPENVMAIGPAIPREGTPVSSPENHDFDGINEEAEDALTIWSGDETEKNAYLNIPMDTNESELSGKTLSMTYLNKEPFDINFMSKTGYADVSWHFQNELVNDMDSFNLYVDHNEEHITFHLGEVSLPYEAEVMVQMKGPNTKYNAYRLDGSFRETFKTDENGYLTIYAKNDADSVKLAKTVVEDEKTATASGALKDGETGIAAAPDSLMLILCILALSGVAIVALVTAAFRRGK